jgi:hypothetical protein
VIRRPLWLAVGAALGVGGTVWTRRRVERLSQRVRPTAVATEVASIVERTRRGASERVRDALDTGRAEAQRQQDALWSDLAARDRVTVRRR